MSKIMDTDNPSVDYRRIPSQYICNYCQKVYRNVSQADCGCRYCSQCLDELLLDSLKCKTCNTEIAKNYKMLDKAFQQEINNFIFNCNEGLLKRKQCECPNHFDKKHHHVAWDYCKETFGNGTCINNQFKNDKYNIRQKDNNAINNFVSTDFGSNHRTRIDKSHMIPNEVSQSTSKNSSVSDSNLNDLNATLVKQKQLYELIKKEFFDIKNKEKKLRDELNESLNVKKVYNNFTERFISQDNIFDNGFLIWKITNVHHKMIEATNGRQNSIYSQPFYTSTFGYKMCGRIHLNGDGMGLGTHLSVYFALMKGDYDALLKWPFRQKITFILIAQSQCHKEDIIDTFRPDPNSVSFQRPSSDINVASGIPLFCPLTKLISKDHGYIKDNILFLKIVVDVRDLADV